MKSTVMANSGLQPAVLAINFVFPAVSFSIVVVRFWRKIVDRSFGGDDVVLGIAMALAIAYCVVSYVYTKEDYYGYHEEDIPMGGIDFYVVAKLQYVRSVIYNPILCLVKASFLWTLMKLRSPRVWLNRCFWIVQIINAGYMIGSTVSSILACLPMERNFDFFADGKCYNVQAYVIASVSIVIITDLMVLAMPTWMIYDLHMPRLRKLVTIAFLSLGLAVTAIGAVRLHYLVRLFVYFENPKHSVQDTFSAMECNIAIIGACGPTVKWILSHCIPFLQSSRTKGSSNYPATFTKGQRGWHMDPIDRSLVSMQRDDDCMYISSGIRGEMELKKADRRHNEFGNDGIMKTVEWNVASDDRAEVPRSDNDSDKRLFIGPTNVV